MTDSISRSQAVSSPGDVPAHVWTYWEDPPGGRKPAYLDLCLETMKRHVGDGATLHVLDAHSIFDWLPDLSPHTWDRLETPVRRSDYGRVRLLERYGGLWLDADCIVMSPPVTLLDLLADYEVVGWGADIGGRFYNGLFAARPRATMIQRWACAQESRLSSAGRDDLGWAALGQDLVRPLAQTYPVHCVPSSTIAPVLWYEWRRLLSPWQNPARVLQAAPMTVMLWNREMGRHLAELGASALLESRMLIGRLFRIALGVSSLDDERDAMTRVAAVSDLRFTRVGRSIETRLRGRSL